MVQAPNQSDVHRHSRRIHQSTLKMDAIREWWGVRLDDNKLPLEDLDPRERTECQSRGGGG